MPWLFIYVLAISLYDLRARRVPNWYTLPVLIAGLVAHLPGHLDLWLASFAISSAWGCGWMGAGDAKLWLAVLWALPVELSVPAIPLMFITFFLTGLIQTALRIIRRQPSTDWLAPGAWRTFPFVLLSWYVH